MTEASAPVASIASPTVSHTGRPGGFGQFRGQNLIGDENNGWAVAHTLLFHEHNAIGKIGHGYLGKMPFFSYPRIPGHELGVEVLEVGQGVTNVKATPSRPIRPVARENVRRSDRDPGTRGPAHHRRFQYSRTGFHADNALGP